MPPAVWWHARCSRHAGGDRPTMLEVFLKKYGWVANLVLLAVAAWLLAKTVNTAVGGRDPSDAARRFRRRAGRPASPCHRQPRRGQALPAHRAEATARRRDGLHAGCAAPAQTCSDLQAAPVATSLRAQLVAGIVAEKPLRSVAVIADKVTGQTRTYGIGEDVQGGKLLSVERIRDDRDPRGRAFRVVAIVCNDGRKEYVDFETGGGGSPVAVAAPNVGVAPVPPPAPNAGAAIPPDGVRSRRQQVRREEVGPGRDPLEPELDRHPGAHRAELQERRRQRVQGLLDRAELASTRPSAWRTGT